MQNEIKVKRFWAEKVILIGILLLLPNSGYLFAFAENSFFYVVNVFLHIGLGLALIVPAFFYGRRLLARDAPRTGKELAIFTGYAGFWFCVAGVAAALYLMVAGNRHESQWVLYAHVAFCFLGVSFLTTAIRRVGHQISIKNRYDTAGRWLLIFTVTGVCIPILVHAYRFIFVHYDERVHNPRFAPASMADEAAGGAQGPFFPSSLAATLHDTASFSFLIQAEACGTSGCHEDIYRQWSSSPHRYSALNSPWYQRALAQTESQAGISATKWCAGCHSPAALLNGTSNLPVAQQAQQAAAHTGVTCTSCHAVVSVRGTMGQGGLVIEKPAMFAWLASNEAWKKRLFAWFVHLDGKPHREAFLQPFHRNENGAFCSSCHKGHVDQALNGTRWVQVMNDYDSWQASSHGLGARDYQRTPIRKDCAACHMPQVQSRDASATRGLASDHRFLGANTLLPLWRNDEERGRATVDYLRDGKITLDIFAMGLAQTPRRKPLLMAADSNGREVFSGLRHERTEIASVMKNIGDEWSLQRVVFDPQQSDTLAAPLPAALPRLLAGQSFRLDVVVRARDVGHYFPAGTADMAQAWLELKIVDERERIIFWSGAVRGEHQQEVDPNAHFYGVHAVDSTGVRSQHPISWNTQAAHSHLLPANSAEVVRYRVQLPEDCGGQLRLFARLNYRKYRPELLAWRHDSTAVLSSAAPDPASRSLSTLGELPIIEMAHAELAIPVGAAPLPQSGPSDPTALAARWQDYGIGLLRQHDVVAAAQAFLNAGTLAPGNIDIWINLGITKLRSGQIADAKELFAKALKLGPEDARAHYYFAMALKAEGDYGAALTHVKQASAVVRRDREFHMELGRLHILLDHVRYSKEAYKRVIHIDPEDPVIYEEMIRTY